MRVLSLAETVAECRQAREMAAEAREIEEAAGEVEIEDWWRHDWLPLVYPGTGSIAIDTGVGEDDPVPVYRNFHDTRPSGPQLPSLGELVTAWIGALDSGAWRYEPVAQQWIWDTTLLDPAVSQTGLA